MYQQRLHYARIELRGRQPYELVVNSVGKDLIVGYLATPKEQAAR